MTHSRAAAQGSASRKQLFANSSGPVGGESRDTQSSKLIIDIERCCYCYEPILDLPMEEHWKSCQKRRAKHGK